MWNVELNIHLWSSNNLFCSSRFRSSSFVKNTQRSIFLFIAHMGTIELDIWSSITLCVHSHQCLSPRLVLHFIFYAIATLSSISVFICHWLLSPGDSYFFWSTPTWDIQTWLHWCIICVLSWEEAWKAYLPSNSRVEEIWWIWS